MKRILIALCIFTVAFAEDGPSAALEKIKAKAKTVAEPVESGIVLGIESVTENKDSSLGINIYLYTPEHPVAGFQIDLLPANTFEVQSVNGGLGDELGFMMQAGASGTVLGFSLQGTKIPVSKSTNPAENIICTINVKLKDAKKKPMEIDLKSIIAGERGTKLEVTTESFQFTPEKK